MSRLAPSQRYLLAVIASIAPLLLAATPASAASLIGDTIEIVNLFPTLSDTNVSGTVVVDSTDTDRVTFGGGSFAHARRPLQHRLQRGRQTQTGATSSSFET